MKLSTISVVPGHKIKEHKGIVFGETIIGANIFKDFLASIRDIVGGRSGSYESVIIEARETSMREMMQSASALGANAILGIKVDYETLGQSNGMLMVTCSGTAVLVEKE